MGSPAQIVFGQAGSGAKIRLGTDAREPGDGPSSSLELSYRSAGSVMPTIDFGLSSRLRAGQSDAEPWRLDFTVGAARPAATQPGRLPPSAAQEIAKLRGSRLSFASRADGASLGHSIELDQDSPDLRPLLMAAGDALSTVVLPYPSEPVGAGAFWMIKSRETCSNADVVAYRMVKVESVESGAAELSVETRRYLAGDAIPLAGLPAHRVRQYQSQGSGKLTLRSGEALPIAAEVHDSFVAVVTTDDRPNQALPIQAELGARFARTAAPAH